MIGAFEAHVTVAPDDGAELERWASARGVKFTHIMLARGRSVSQPMLTVRTAGTLAEARASAARTVASLRADGFRVLRTKIEASPSTSGIPLADGCVPGYFEHHVKLVLAPAADQAALVSLVVPHGAHVSRNARRTRPDGRAERFVTQRCHHVGAVTAGRRLDALTTALLAHGYDIAAVEREYVVYDGDPSLDDGWITEGTP
ncbi:hypothetical protein BTM25_01830 [Actinomadura rubteroloni]|uniref:Ankyrin n=1 Tax=Actinomadura rubteroloni TaxID=1926885 RepID=A0A2P4UL71_9ACTN|nr:hypothetical protein BTM25_01830 [Actinomadura rubteroloni]